MIHLEQTPDGIVDDDSIFSETMQWLVVNDRRTVKAKAAIMGRTARHDA